MLCLTLGLIDTLISYNAKSNTPVQWTTITTHYDVKWYANGQMAYRLRRD